MIDRNRALLSWYGRSRRRLPWRETSDPWPILVSEVMAQQTQITRVVPAFERFMAEFPTPADLASADLATALRLWDGLGYQRRIVNLRRAAGMVAESGWPTDTADLERLPGVGPYTAAAVACFAFGAVVPAIDTNLRRVLSRWEGDALQGADLRWHALSLIDPADPAAWNQAIMDLGATICRPQAPDCGVCPVAAWCRDPGVYVAPPRQSQYQGSVRQARAAILKTLAAQGPCAVATLTRELELDPDRVSAALESLNAEGTVRLVDDLADLS